MLLSNIYYSTISSSAVSSDSLSSIATSMVISPGLPQYGTLVVIGLIMLLFLKEALSASRIWNEYLKNSFNLAIVPLFFVFVAIVAYKVMEII